MGEKLHEQFRILEQISALRPYHDNKVATNGLLQDLEGKIDESFNLADLIAFADGAEDYAKEKWGHSGRQIVQSREHWKGNLEFHTELSCLWHKLSAQIQAELRAGKRISDVIRDAGDLMISRNRSLCSAPASFKFKQP
jgi:hypothetical protein